MISNTTSVPQEPARIFPGTRSPDSPLTGAAQVRNSGELAAAATRREAVKDHGWGTTVSSVDPCHVTLINIEQMRNLQKVRRYEKSMAAFENVAARILQSNWSDPAEKLEVEFVLDRYRLGLRTGALDLTLPCTPRAITRVANMWDLISAFSEALDAHFALDQPPMTVYATLEPEGFRQHPPFIVEPEMMPQVPTDVPHLSTSEPSDPEVQEPSRELPVANEIIETKPDGSTDALQQQTTDESHRLGESDSPSPLIEPEPHHDFSGIVAGYQPDLRKWNSRTRKFKPGVVPPKDPEWTLPKGQTRKLLERMKKVFAPLKEAADAQMRATDAQMPIPEPKPVAGAGGARAEFPHRNEWLKSVRAALASHPDSIPAKRIAQCLQLLADAIDDPRSALDLGVMDAKWPIEKEIDHFFAWRAAVSPPLLRLVAQSGHDRIPAYVANSAPKLEELHLPSMRASTRTPSVRQLEWKHDLDHKPPFEGPLEIDYVESLKRMYAGKSADLEVFELRVEKSVRLQKLLIGCLEDADFDPARTTLVAVNRNENGAPSVEFQPRISSERDELVFAARRVCVAILDLPDGSGPVVLLPSAETALVRNFRERCADVARSAAGELSHAEVEAAAESIFNAFLEGAEALDLSGFSADAVRLIEKSGLLDELSQARSKGHACVHVNTANLTASRQPTGTSQFNLKLPFLADAWLEKILSKIATIENTPTADPVVRNILRKSIVPGETLDLTGVTPDALLASDFAELAKWREANSPATVRLALPWKCREIPAYVAEFTHVQQLIISWPLEEGAFKIDATHVRSLQALKFICRPMSEVDTKFWSAMSVGNKVLLAAPFGTSVFLLPPLCVSISLRFLDEITDEKKFELAALKLRGNVTRNTKLHEDLPDLIGELATGLRFELEVVDLSRFSSQTVTYAAKSGIATLFADTRSKERRCLRIDTSTSGPLHLEKVQIRPLQLKLPENLKDPQACLDAFRGTQAL